MIQAQPNNVTKRVFKVTSVLMFISAFVVIIIGYSLTGTNTDIKKLNEFLSETENLQSNFEQSLQLYTEGAEESMNFVASLRPENDIQYIQFISEVESLAEELAIDIDLESVEAEIEPSSKGNTLAYEINFYGNRDDLTDFLSGLEQMQYFIKIYEISYTNTELLTEEDTVGTPNVSIKIKLYVK
ncbi:MAG: hypothetical protein WCT46_01800 [Candidatus Gracilibacteria bacterium]|jgi:hypothetical protein